MHADAMSSIQNVSSSTSIMDYGIVGQERVPVRGSKYGPCLLFIFKCRAKPNSGNKWFISPIIEIH